jgi:hypothetical protein
MPYKRGDVVLVLFPDSNLRTAKRGFLYRSEAVLLSFPHHEFQS